MKNLSTRLKKAFLIVGLIFAAVLVNIPVNASEDGINSALIKIDPSPRANLSDDHSGDATGNIGLVIPLTPSFSFDLGLSSVGTGQVPPGEKKFGTPPIPMSKTGSDLRYGRLGVGLSFGF